MSATELGSLLNILAKEYRTTFPVLLKRLDSVSGNLDALARVLNGDSCVEWTKEEDEMLSRNSDLLVRWKGQEAVQLRSKYLAKK